MTYRIEFITRVDHPKRGICFLISDNKKVAAKPKFDNLKKDIERLLMTRFDAWIDGQPDKPNRYHGWNKSAFQGRYTHCFVFKAKSNRFYGFLCNPKPYDRSYQFCVLVRHAIKKDHETDETDLKQVEEFRSTITIQRMISDHFKV